MVDQEENTLYAVNGGSNTVAVIDTDRCNARARRSCPATPTLVQVPGGPELLALDPLTNTVYVGTDDCVAVIDTATCNGTLTSGCAEQSGVVAVGEDARGDVLDQATGTVFVTNADSNSVSAIDTASSAPRRRPDARPSRRRSLSAARPGESCSTRSPTPSTW